MKFRNLILPALIVFVFIVVFLLQKVPFRQSGLNPPVISKQTAAELPIYLSSLRKRSYPASPIQIEETLAPGINYQRYIASYKSDGLKIFGLYTIPNEASSDSKVPAIVFLHGYLDPKTYVTTERYVAYQDGFARQGFVTFKPDLRGHGHSDGQPVNSNFSPEYVIDTLNLVAALKIDDKVDAKRIGVWGHSNGGGIGLRMMVISQDIKAGIFWAGVVGSYDDLLERYRQRIPWLRLSSPVSSQSASIQEFLSKYGSPSANPAFWNNIDPYAHLAEISEPVQLHHGTADTSVPIEFSRHLAKALQDKNKSVEEYEYEGADHNLGGAAFGPAMARSVAFFKKYL